MSSIAGLRSALQLLTIRLLFRDLKIGRVKYLYNQPLTAVQENDCLETL
jgi:hypothetical protein